ncbi:MAG TPA: DUF885 domain-containing protein [Candidatus Angelobacter sp.]
MILSRVAVFFLAATALMGQTSNQSASPSAMNAKFAKLVEAFMDESLTLSPATASDAGYHKHVDKKTGKTIELDGLLDDVGPEGVAAQRRLYTEWRERFRKETPLSSLKAEDAADWQLIDDQISLGLLNLDRIQGHRHNATMYVELVGDALFQPLTNEYAATDVRLGHILSRIGQIPRFLNQARQQLVDSDPIYIKVALEENQGNIDLIQGAIAPAIPAGSKLRAEYDKVAPAAIRALQDFSKWLENDLGKRPNPRSWRLGKELYPEKFRLVMQTPVTPQQVLADAERDIKATRAEMMEIAVPLHKQMYPEHGDHADLNGTERENLVIGEVLRKISDDRPQRDQLMETVKADLAAIRQFIIDKKIVSLKQRDNLKVIPTPGFMRGVYSVAGFHSAPPLDPSAEAQYWVTPIDPKMSDERAESKLREYNNWVLQWLSIHEALPGHYVQAEHANDVSPVTRRLTRSLFANGAYAEGWAEYVAQVMMRSGYANNDPRYRISYLKVWLRALANAVLDVRMHTMNMTDAEAMELMTKYGFQTQAEADGKLQRAKLSSVQLPTYYVGTREWWRLRNKYEAAKGKDFNLAEFHDRALDEGALPLGQLEKILLPATNK